FPQLGTGAIEPMVNLAYGASLRGLPEGFVSAQLGWRMRGGEVSDELPYSLKIGAFFHPRIGTFAGVRGWESRGTFEDIDPTYALTASDSEALAATGELYVRVHRNVDVSAAWSRPMRGRNSGIGHEWSLGIAIHSR
ncbi:MAG TPA: hypothetical protein VFO89_07390, partial [Thermoanaerobaculia bacterium]|nr:hypothetical protein [Thermoanaerobaculia bacterium]